jgi:ABC-2 type transport system permease protein
VAARSLEGIDVRFPADREELKRQVEANDLDAGLVLQEGFDRDVLSGASPPLNLYFSGESLASNRAVLAVTAVDMVRTVAGQPAPVAVLLDDVGDVAAVPIADRLAPLVILMALMLGGTFMPASSLVQEKERGTLLALVTTPAQMQDAMFAKGLLGIIAAALAGGVTLALNGGFGASPLALVLALLVAVVMTAEFGLMLGGVAKDMTSMYAIWKSAGILVFAPAIFFLFPGLPQWIAKLFPTYYFLAPIFEITASGAALAGVAADLAIGAGICVALLVPVVLIGRRMQGRLAIG